MHSKHERLEQFPQQSNSMSSRRKWSIPSSGQGANLRRDVLAEETKNKFYAVHRGLRRAGEHTLSVGTVLSTAFHGISAPGNFSLTCVIRQEECERRITRRITLLHRPPAPRLAANFGREKQSWGQELCVCLCK